MNIKDYYIKKVRKYYDESHRSFHSWKHIQEGLNIFDITKDKNIEQEIAWIYHDVVYNPGSSDNEQLSAIKAIEDIKASKHSNFIDVNKIGTMIMDTKVHIPTIEDSKLVLDIDMSCLALENYEDFFSLRLEAVKEYLIYPKEVIIKGIHSFVDSTLKQDKIFNHKDFQYKNAIAKNNLIQFKEEFETNQLFLDLFRKKLKIKTHP